MFKKILISVVVVFFFGFIGCFDSGDLGSNVNLDYKIIDIIIDQSLVCLIFDLIFIFFDFDILVNFDLVLFLGVG